MTHQFKRPIYLLQTKINGFMFYINRGYAYNHKIDEMTLDPEEAERFENVKVAFNFIKTYRLRGFDPVPYKPEIPDVPTFVKKPKKSKNVIVKKIEKLEAFTL